MAEENNGVAHLKCFRFGENLSIWGPFCWIIKNLLWGSPEKLKNNSCILFIQIIASSLSHTHTHLALILIIIYYLHTTSDQMGSFRFLFSRYLWPDLFLGPCPWIFPSLFQGLPLNPWMFVSRSKLLRDFDVHINLYMQSALSPELSV